MIHLVKYLAFVVICVSFSTLGCTKTSDPLSPGSGTLPTDGLAPGANDGSLTESGGGKRKELVPTESPEPEPPPIKLAEVKLSEKHAALCNVKAGDPMPEIELPDVSGSPTELNTLFGEKLTVVVFWSGENAQSREALADLGPDVAAVYSAQGLKVVGIAVGETAESAKSRLEAAEATYPNLIDTDATAFAKVGTEKLPRTFLLDAQGRILWFDIEYSRSTRRELNEGIQFVLGQSS